MAIRLDVDLSAPTNGTVRWDFDFIRTLYTFCGTCSVSFGTVLNVFLFWLIRNKTPAPMLGYSKLLMVPCILDMFFAVFTFLVQPIIIVDHGYFGVIQNGFFRKVPEFYNYTANVLWFQILLLFVCCTTGQFVFRYYMIISDGEIPKTLKYASGLVVAVLLCVHVLMHYLSDYPFEWYLSDMEQLSKKIYQEVGITDIRFSSFTPARSWLWIGHCAAMLAIFAICYGIILFCALGTVRYIAKTAALVVDDTNKADRAKNDKMREYNRQITRALLIQAILPTIDVLELGIQTTFPVIFNEAVPIYYMVYATAPLYFFPVLNPLATMIFVKPYRMALLKVFGLQQIAGVKSTQQEVPRSNQVNTVPTAAPRTHSNPRTTSPPTRA